MSPNRTANHAAYRRLKDAIARTYEAGRFVAIADGRIAADAGDFDALRARLVAAGKDPAAALVVQAGVDYPEAAVIFSSELP